MSDIALLWDIAGADFGIEENDYVLDEGLESAVFLSLFTDRRAEAGDVLPEGETDRRGWWGDTNDDKIGSRLWLLSRSKQTTDTLTRAQEYATEALQWMLDDRVSDQIDVTTEYVRPGMMGIAVTISRPKLDPVQYRYNYTWAAQEARRA